MKVYTIGLSKEDLLIVDDDILSAHFGSYSDAWIFIQDRIKFFKQKLKKKKDGYILKQLEKFQKLQIFEIEMAIVSIQESPDYSNPFK